MKEYFYLSDKNELIKITGMKKPSKSSKPYVCRELVKGDWVLGSFPEITYGQLLNMSFIGYRTITEDWEHTREMCS